MQDLIFSRARVLFASCLILVVSPGAKPAGADVLISGTVLAGGAPLPGVVMSGLPEGTVTDASGAYTATVPAGSTFTVTPIHPYYMFEPASRTYTEVTVDLPGQDHAATLVQTPQRRALIAFYNATNGDAWTDNSGWKTPPLYPDGFAMPGTEAAWHGLTIDPVTQSVTIISLSDNNLVGSIPAEIGGLAGLREIHLSNNHLTGSIPPEMGDLTRLYKLSMANNLLSGPIPAELGNLPDLGYLYLNTNGLSGTIPPELFSLPDLAQVFLYSNELSGSIPPEIGNATGLRWIVLRDNNLTGGIPVELGNLTGLLVLRLGDNQLTGEIPAVLGNLTSLQSLRLSGNRLTGTIPDSLGSLTQLWELLLHSNQLAGPIPSSLTNLTALTATNIGYNALFTADAALSGFLTSKDPDWAATQTVAPTQVTATSLDDAVVLVSWLPVAYTGAAGYYRVMISEDPGGPYTPAGQTADKTTSSVQVTGLTPGTRYYFVVCTVTDAHASNQNIVESGDSAEASAVAWLQTEVRISGVVTAGGSPLAGAVLSGLPEGTVTDSTGAYSAIVPADFSGTVTPVLAGYAFSPVSRIYTHLSTDQSAQDYAATVITATVKKDFNGDGQEDILWRYYGEGPYQGLNVAWLMNPVAPVPAPLLAASDVAQGRSLLTGEPTGVLYRAERGGAEPPAADPRGPLTSVVTGERTLAVDPKHIMRDPLDHRRGHSKSAVERAGGKNQATRLVRKDAASAAALDDGTAKIAALQPATEVVFSQIPDTGWEIAGTGDFNGDAKTDILWRYYGMGPYQGLNDIWFMDGTTFIGESVFSQIADLNWRIVGTRDFNGDGQTDILWRYYGTGAYQGLNVVWFMNGAQFAGEAVFSQVLDTAWKIEGTGDFNADGETDILWRYYGTGPYQGLNDIWFMNDTTFVSEAVFSQILDTNWQIGGTGDFNNDGQLDILWRYYGAGAYQGLNDIWYMNGITFVGEEVFSVISDTNWRIVNR